MTDTTINIIVRFELGYFFTVGNFSMAVEDPKAVSKTINHSGESGYLCKLSK